MLRLGRWIARHPMRVIVAWVAIAVGVGLSAVTFGADFRDSFRLPGTEAQAGLDQLRDAFPEYAGGTANVVVVDSNAAIQTHRDVLLAVQSRLGAIDGVVGVTDFADPNDAISHISVDQYTAYWEVRFSERPEERADPTKELRAAVAPLEAAGLDVHIGGEAVTYKHVESKEAVGLLVAIVVLLIALRSLRAMGATLIAALVGLGVAMAGVLVVAGVIPVSRFTPTLAVLLGLAVGIDYALFIITRFRGFLGHGLAVDESVGRALATAGSAVVFAGGTVVVALAGIVTIGIPLVSIMGLASAGVVAIVAACGITLLPALLALWGAKMVPTRGRHGAPSGLGVAEPGGAEALGWSARWAAAVERRPLIGLVGALAVLGVLCVPLASLRLAMADAGSDPVGTSTRAAYDELARAFGAGFNGPLAVPLDLESVPSDQRERAIDSILGAVREDTRVAAAVLVSRNGSDALIGVAPAHAPDAPETAALVHELRSTLITRGLERFASGSTGASAVDPLVMEAVADVAPEALSGAVSVGQIQGATSMEKPRVTGLTAFLVDLSGLVSRRLPGFVAVVVGVSFLLLMAVFRSPWVALKAVVGNLASIGAAFGVVVAVFQWGWGASLIGVDQAVPIAPFVPLVMFAVLFGLSMDYEVFILSRVREAYVIDGLSAREAVVAGISSSAKVILAAAAIMVAVFASAIAASDPLVKMFGVGLTAAVVLDSTLVRIVFVPAALSLLGDRAWRLPAWLDRALPRFDLEGESLLHDLEANDPARHPAVATGAPFYVKMADALPDSAFVAEGPGAERTSESYSVVGVVGREPTRLNRWRRDVREGGEGADGELPDWDDETLAWLEEAAGWMPEARSSRGGPEVDR